MKFNLFDILLPRETKFYAFLVEHADALLSTTAAFQELIRDLPGLSPADLKTRVGHINDLEKMGDVVEMKIIQELNDTFITPIDREDIHAMAMSFDRAIDILNSLANKIDIYGIQQMPANVSRFLDLTVEIAAEVKTLILNFQKKKGVEESIRKVHDVENKGDYLFHLSMAELFQNTKDPIEVIKLKQVYELLEDTIDAVDFVGKIIRRVSIKQG